MTPVVGVLRLSSRWMQAVRPVAALAALFAGSCTHTPASGRPRPPPAPEAPDEAYFEAGGPVPGPLEARRVEHGASHEIVRVLVPARVPAALREVPRAEDPIEVLRYLPRDDWRGARPLVLCSPIMGNDTLLVGHLASQLARLGIQSAVVLRKELEFDPEASVDRAEAEMRLVVMRNRQALDWLLTQPDVDRDRVASLGVSAGAIVSAVHAGTDARFRAHVLILGGGPLADVLMDTTERRFRRYERQVRAARGWSRELIRSELRRALRSDPVLVAGRVAREDVLLILARQDRSVPYARGLALWEALGRPERIVTPFGHYTTFLLFPWMESKVTEFLAGRLGAPGDPTRRPPGP